jgi:hypothetical protein
MYLDVADSANLPYGWSRSAQFSLAIVNQIDQKFTTRKGLFLLHHVHALHYLNLHLHEKATGVCAILVSTKLPNC